MSTKSILFACPDFFFASYRTKVLENLGFKVHTSDNTAEIVALLTGPVEQRPSLLIADSFIPMGTEFSDHETNGGTETGVAIYERIRKTDQTLPVIVFTTTRRTFNRIREVKDPYFLAINDCAPNATKSIIAGAQRLLATS